MKSSHETVRQRGEIWVVAVGLLFFLPGICHSGGFDIGVYHDPVTVWYFWHDPDTDSMSDSLADYYIAQLDSFGVDFVIGLGVPQLIQICQDHGIEVVPYNVFLGYNSMVRISGMKPYYLEAFVDNGRWYEMEPEKDIDTLRGYTFRDESATGSNGQFWETPCRRALISAHQPGLLMRKVVVSDTTDTSGIFRWFGSQAAARTDKFLKDWMEGWDSGYSGNDSLLYHRAYFVMAYDGAICGDSGVIAQIRIDNLNWDNPGKKITIVNDTLLVEQYGVTRSIKDPKITWSVGDPYRAIYYNGSLWGYACDAIKDIHPFDFSSPGQWDTISVLYWQDIMDYLVRWTDSANLYIDKFFLSNKASWSFKKADNAELASRVDSLNQYILHFGVDSGTAVTDVIPKWYPYDEPWNGIFYPIKHCKELLSSCTDLGNIDMMASMAGSGGRGAIQMATIVEDMPDYVQQMGSFYGYESTCDVSPYTNTNTSDKHNIQFQLQHAIENMEMHSTLARGAGLRFIPVLYPGGYFEKDGSVYVQKTKEAYGPDVQLQAYLCVAYGASGLMYWPYRSYGDISVLPQTMLPESYRFGMSANKEDCPEFDSTEVSWNNRSFVIQVRGSEDEYIKVNGPDSWYKWSAGQKVHSILNRIEDTLDGREFVAAGDWQHLGGGAFVNISSQEYGDSAAFIQWAQFTSKGTPYYMLINRRTWPGPEACQCPQNLSDSQHVYFALNAGPSGDVWAYNICTNDSVLLIDSANSKTGTIYLPPGEAAIFRLKGTGYNWKSSFAGINHFPEGGTHYLSGDITIDTGATFTIGQGAKLISLANVDSCATGTNTSKAELIVKGHLRAIGSGYNQIQFKATTDTTAAWYGIRVIGNGAADIQFADIKNAYIGYQNNSTNAADADTLQLVSFEKCRPYGAILNKANMVVDNIYIQSDLTTAIGMHLDSLADLEISDCYFDSVKYALEIDHSTPTIRNSEFAYCKYGIWIDKNPNTDTAKIYGCTFDDGLSRTGNTFNIVFGQNRSRCRVDSSFFDGIWNYGIWNALDSTKCHIRRCYFRRFSLDAITDYAVYTKGRNTDLGVDYDSDSLNYFATQVWFESPYHIYNSSATDTTEANSCCFEDTLFAGLFHGLIDLADGQQLADCRVNFYWPKSFGGSAPVPLEYTMLQNYPNPFNPTTTIAYSIPEACDVKIRIYNILGQVVTTLVDEYKTPGEYAVVWDGNDADGRPVASGMYFYQMRAGQYMSSKKMLMLK